MEHDDFLKHNNIIIENITPNEGQARLKITDSSLNPYGIVHGGLIFALGDTIMSLTCKNTGRKAVTLDANISFLKPGKGKFLIATSKVIKIGKTTSVLSAEIADDNNNIVAVMQATYYFIDWGIMEKIGIICEYNPFHNGHLYHIKKIKELYPESLIILILNGYFLERGEISILTKEDKTKIALDNNIDIVLELPFIFGTQSADTFAEISLKILNNFNIDKLIFGSECNDSTKLISLAKKQLDPSYQINIKTYLKQGLNYPTALAKSLNADFNFLPNDLLGISYAKAIIKYNYPIDIITIKRTNDYHDLKSNVEIVSASNIRNKLNENENITKYVPTNIPNKIINVNKENYFKLLKYKINTDDNLKHYLDVDEGIEYRLQKYINISNTIEEFIYNIKTKRYTYNKLNRMFIHIITSLKKEYNTNLSYIKILGFNKKGQNYLNSFKEFSIPIIVDKNSLQYKYELTSSIIYDLINNTNTYEFEKRNKPVIKD